MNVSIVRENLYRERAAVAFRILRRDARNCKAQKYYINE